MTDFVARVLKEWNLAEMPMPGDPRRDLIAKRVLELEEQEREENAKPRMKQDRLGVSS